MHSNINKSLAEQLQINDREIAHRKRLLSITDQEEQLLRSYSNQIRESVDHIVESFYKKQTQIPEISLLIGDAETLRRLKNAMHNYVTELFQGYYDADYVNRRLRIGKIHHRIGVSPKLYISAIYLLMSTIFEVIDREENPELKQVLKSAVQKLLLFDIQLVFDTYISGLVQHVYSANQQLEEYTQSLEKTVAERTAKLEELSRTDELTGLYNTRAFYEHLRRELLNCERYQHSLSLLYLDLNHFKKINDQFGHDAGDLVLKAAGAAMIQAVRETDYACRYGGDEFCIIMPRAGQLQAEDAAKRLIQIFTDLEQRDVSLSIGIVSVHPNDKMDMNSLIHNADQLMYHAKRQSREKNASIILTSNSAK